MTTKQAKTKRKTASVQATSSRAKPARGKTEKLIGLLQRSEGITIVDAARKLGWQAHSVRGVISGVLKSKRGLKVEPVADGGIPRRYRIV
ncbi:MAG: DUF3489 domain-containing protein [Rhodospirillaceae bacterium]|nr:DUF3489 domain-containing protein [Rhodospirillaceae bacterium]